MENMYILKSNNSIIFNDGNINEVVFNFKEYKDILNNLSTEKYDFFKIMYDNRHEGISKDEIIMSVLLVIAVICIATAVSMVVITK